MMRFHFFFIFVLFCLIPFPATANGDESQNGSNEYRVLIEEVEGEQALFEFSRAFPESPGLSIAGIDTSNLTSANELREAALYIPQFFASDGEFTLGVDISPWQLFYDTDTSKLSLKNYGESNYSYRLMRRTKVSAVARRGVDDSADEKDIGSLFSLGLTTSLTDKSDPLYIKYEAATSLDKTCTTDLEQAAIEQAKTPYVPEELAAYYDDLDGLRGRGLEPRGLQKFSENRLEIRVKLLSGFEAVKSYIKTNKPALLGDVPEFPNDAENLSADKELIELIN